MRGDERAMDRVALHLSSCPCPLPVYHHSPSQQTNSYIDEATNLDLKATAPDSPLSEANSSLTRPTALSPSPS
jgi:hypothetical protein